MISQIFRTYRTRFILSGILSTFASFTGIAMLSAINNNIAQGTSGSYDILVFAVLIVAMLGVGFGSQYILSILSANIVTSLRSTMLKRIMSTEFRNLETIGGHRIHATVTTDVATIANALSTAPLFLYNGMTIIFCFAYLLYLSWQHVILLAVITGLAMVTARIFMSRGSANFKVLREHEDQLFHSLKQLVDGGREMSLSSNRSFHFLNREALPGLKLVEQADIKAAKYWSLGQNWANAMLFVALATIVLSANSWLALSGETISGFVLVITYLIGPMSFVMSSIEILSRGKIAYNKILSLKISDTPESEVTRHQASDFKLEDSTIKAKQLTYCYPQSEEGETPFQVGPVDLEIPANQITIICGGNGSGKSSFAKLLVGLYAPTEGSIQVGDITLDNDSIVTDNARLYRNQFSTVFSDFYLFDTVLCRDGMLADDDKTKQLIDKLKLTGKVNVENGRLSTTKLSHGQKKRLALLIAYMEDAPIYVFDEWAADQDPYFRDLFYTELLPELKAKGKTVVVISHDERYFYVADNLLKFELGSLVTPEPVQSPTPKGQAAQAPTTTQSEKIPVNEV